MLKREYDKIKLEKKVVKFEFERFKRENMFKDYILREKEKEIFVLKEQFIYFEEDLKKVEKEKYLLKRKIFNYRKVVESFNGENVVSVSFVDKMMSESFLNDIKNNVNIFVLFDELMDKMKEVDLEEYFKKLVFLEILKLLSIQFFQNKRL